MLWLNAWPTRARTHARARARARSHATNVCTHARKQLKCFTNQGRASSHTYAVSKTKMTPRRDPTLSAFQCTVQADSVPSIASRASRM